MIFHENCLLADNSHEISYLIFSKIKKMSQKLSSAADVIDTLRVNPYGSSHVFDPLSTRYFGKQLRVG